MNDLSFKNDSSKKPFFKRKKSCPFSGPNAPAIDYKDVKLLSRYVTERGKIIPSRIAIIAVDIGLLLYPKNSIPITLLKPWERLYKINASIIPGINTKYLFTIIS